MRYRIVVQAFVARQRSPFLTHIFAGRSFKAAAALYAAHERLDPVLHAIVDTGQWEGQTTDYAAFGEDLVTGEQWDLDDARRNAQAEAAGEDSREFDDEEEEEADEDLEEEGLEEEEDDAAEEEEDD